MYIAVRCLRMWTSLSRENNKAHKQHTIVLWYIESKSELVHRYYFSRNLTHFMRSLCPKQLNYRVTQKTCANARHSGGIVLKLFSIALTAWRRCSLIGFTPITNKVIFFEYASNDHSLHPPPTLKYYHYYIIIYNHRRHAWTRFGCGGGDDPKNTYRRRIVTYEKKQMTNDSNVSKCFPSTGPLIFLPHPQNLIGQQTKRACGKDNNFYHKHDLIKHRYFIMCLNNVIKLYDIFEFHSFACAAHTRVSKN